jgi:putative intracellular protease/amidase
VPPTVDAASLSPDFNGGPDGAREMQEAVHAATELTEPLRLEDVNLDDYAAVFVPGGWGPMEDLSGDPEAGRLMGAMLASGKPLALVCHGPAALLTTGAPDAPSPFAGYRLTGLSNAEERLNGLADRAKWLLEDRLVELGVDYRAGEPFAPHVEVDRNLYTGQNPSSAVPLAEQVLAALADNGVDVPGSPNVALVRRLYESRMAPEVAAEIIAPAWSSTSRRASRRAASTTAGTAWSTSTTSSARSCRSTSRSTHVANTSTPTTTTTSSSSATTTPRQRASRRSRRGSSTCGRSATASSRACSRPATATSCSTR